MGNKQSYPGLTDDVLEDYSTLTYLSKGEILYLMKKFYSINPTKMKADPQCRFTKEDILSKFFVLQNNPFKDRIFSVFSSRHDNCFSFEDMLDLCSVMSSDCPTGVKATWAFRIYDLDGDNQISAEDISQILDRLTSNHLETEAKNKIIHTILKEVNLDTSGSIGLSEFKLIMTRLPEFSTSFYFKL